MARPRKTENGGNTGTGNESNDTGRTDSGTVNATAFTIEPITVDPATIGGTGIDGGSGGSDGSNTGEPVRKRRGRKPGSTNAKKNPPLDINGIEFILYSTHQMLAKALHPMLQLDRDESKALATSIANVARHYDITATEKTVDWIGLCMTIGSVYGTRIMAMRLAAADAKRKARENANDPTTVAPFIPSQAGAIN